MPYTYLFTPLAAGQFKKAYLWYQERSVSIAENFELTVNKKIEIICSDPKRYPNKYKFFRETSLSKYPFSIIYFIDEKEMIVGIATIHHHKKSARKKYQLK